MPSYVRIYYSAQKMIYSVRQIANDNSNDSFLISGQNNKVNGNFRKVLEIKCKSNIQAKAIAANLRKNKSRSYFQNLIKYPELLAELLNEFDF